MSLSDILQPYEAGKYISNMSNDVFIDKNVINSISNKICEQIKEKEDTLSINRWSMHQLLPQGRQLDSVEWVFVSDVLNFSFWTPPESKFIITYEGVQWTGFWSLCAAMCRAINEGVNIADARYYSQISLDELKYVLRSDDSVEMPMLEQRIQNLHQAGEVLLKKYDGKFANVVKSCDKSAAKLLHIILEEFPSFRDTAQYGGKTVGFYKRAQILVGDVWACMGGEGMFNFKDIDSLTAFADYRIPQALVWLGALSYSDELMSLLKKDYMFSSGDRLEVEIRGCTIWAVELIVEEVKKLLKDSDGTANTEPINSVVIDHFLWDFRREHDSEMLDIPFHKIRCIYY